MSKMSKKILILGSAGQIGSHLIEYLKKKNFITYDFDIVNNKKQDLRIHNNIILNNLIKKSDFIFFLAFDVGGSRYLKLYQDSAQFISNNLLIMENTFSLIRKHNKKFIFASSQMSNMGHSNYGLLKRIGENYTKILKGITVKFWNVYGLEKDISKSHVVTDFILNGLKSETVKMLTNGKEEREFLYAEDCCRGLEIIMNNFSIFKEKTTEIDLTSNKLSSILAVAKIITKLFVVKGKRVKFVPAKTKDTVQLNKKNKANKFLFKYWRPKFSLNQGIQEVFEYYWNRSRKI
jgi:nucleoside-diphosphate-sugar epimerase